MASNISYPDNSCVWFIKGDNLALVVNVDASGDTRTTGRKSWKAISESVTDGLLLFYYAEPNKVTAITDTPDVDNTLHLSIVDYVKKQLYLDKAGQSQSQDEASVSMNMSAVHQKRWDDAIKKFGMKKRSKTGGDRRVLPANFT